MRPTIQLAGVTALALAAWLGVWLLVREPDRSDELDEPDEIGASVGAVASKSVGAAAPDTAATLDSSDRSPAVDAAVRTPLGAAEIEDASQVTRAESREEHAALVHLFGTVAGIPFGTRRRNMPAGSGDARGDLEWQIENFGRPAVKAAEKRESGPPRGQVREWKGDVQVVDEDGHAESTLIDMSGNYSFPGLHAGRWELSAKAGGCQTLRMELDLRADEVERRLDLRMQGQVRLQVKLIVRPGARRPPESPAEAELRQIFADPELRHVFLVNVLTSREPPGKILDASRVGHTPPCELWVHVPSPTEPASSEAVQPEGAQTRTLVLADPLPLHVSAVLHGVVLETELADVGADGVTLVIDGDRVLDCIGSVRLRVVDAEGGRIPQDCTVGISSQPERFGYHITSEASTAVPEPSGDVVFPKLAAGPMTLTIRADGYESIARAVQVLPGDATDLGTFELARWRTISGRTLDAEGRPVSVLLNAFPLDQFEATRVELSKRFFKSNEEGELKIASVGRGRYLLRVKDERWGAAPSIVDTTNGSVQGVEIRVGRKVDVDLRFEHRLPPNDLLRVSTTDGLPVLESETATGRVQRIRLVPGLYALRLTHDAEDVLRSALFVDTKPVEIAIPTGK